jgi:hypothetical protein
MEQEADALQRTPERKPIAQIAFHAFDVQPV